MKLDKSILLGLLLGAVAAISSHAAEGQAPAPATDQSQPRGESKAASAFEDTVAKVAPG